MNKNILPCGKKICYSLYSLVVLFILTVLLVTSCEKKPTSYGVVLWGGKSFSLSPNTIVEIHNSAKKNEITFSTLQDNLTYTAKQSFIEQFNTKAQAESFTKEYSLFKNTYGVAMVDGIRLRKNAVKGKTQIHTIDLGEEVKVIDKKEVSRDSTLIQEVWYRIITEDGYEGYCLSNFLSLRDRKKPFSESIGKTKYTELKRQFFSNTWRPQYMEKMIKQGEIDLERFNPEIGLFPNIKNNQITIHTAKTSYTFQINDPVTTPPKTIIFADGNLKIHFMKDAEIIAEYEYRGTMIRERYTQLDVSIEKAIEQEKQRRKIRYKLFLSKGSDYSSSQYGTLHFKPDYTVIWKDRDTIPLEVFPVNSKQKGTIRFNVFLSSKLDNKYNGAFTLNFSASERPNNSVFTYSFAENGITLIYIPEKYIIKNEIKQIPPPPHINMYFSNNSKR